MNAIEISDIRKIVDSIRFFISNGSRTSEAELRKWAVEYSRFCAYVNERLQQCRDFLRRGLRSEAIHAAQHSPSVLEMITTLEFDDRDIWQDYCENHGLPSAPELLTEIAAELNEAYSVQIPIRELLENHRRAALSRAPLKERLAILHKLARTDAENDIWEQDVRDYEKERFREIEKEFKSATAEGDLRLLMEVRRELSSENWMALNVTDARKAADSAIAKVNIRQSRDELGRLSELLRDAHASMNREEGRRLRDEWQRHSLVAGLTLGDPLSQAAAPSLDWLVLEDKRQADERHYQNAILAMEQALDDSAPQEEIERQYYSLVNLDRPIHPIIEARVRGRMQQHEIAGKRKSTLLVIGALGIVVLVGAITIFFVRYSIYNRNVTIATESLNHLMDNRMFGKADEYFVTLRSSDQSVAESSQVQSCMARLDEAKGRGRSGRSL